MAGAVVIARLATAGALLAGAGAIAERATAGAPLLPGEADAGLPSLHAAGLDGLSEVVGIISTGLDPDHCDLADTETTSLPIDGTPLYAHRKIAGYWSLPTTTEGLACDWDRHGLGTAMASFAAGRADPLLSLPTDGVAPATRVAVVDVHDEMRDGAWSCRLETTDLAAALGWLVRTQDVAAVAIGCWDNPYLTGGQYTARSVEVDAAVAREPGLLVIAPAGDIDPRQPAEWAPPATAKNVLVASLAVPAHGGGWERAGSAARAPSTAAAPVLYLPGDAWDLAISDGDPATFQCDRYACSSTGAAAAAIAGAAALSRQAWQEGRRAGAPERMDRRRGFAPRSDLQRALLLAAAAPGAETPEVRVARLAVVPGDGASGPLWYQAPEAEPADAPRTFAFVVTAPGRVRAALVWNDPPQPAQPGALACDHDLSWTQPAIPSVPRRDTAWELLEADLPAGSAAVEVRCPPGAQAPYALVVDGPVALPPAGDWDGDGLDNHRETTEWGTDPMVADTDGDGLDDGAESTGWRALHRDHDADLLPDLWAERYGWEPLPGTLELPPPLHWWPLDQAVGPRYFDEQSGAAPLQTWPLHAAGSARADGLLGKATTLGGALGMSLSGAPLPPAAPPWTVSCWIRLLRAGRLPLFSVAGADGSGWLLALTDAPARLEWVAFDAAGTPLAPAAQVDLAALEDDGWHQLSIAVRGSGAGGSPGQPQLVVRLDGREKLALAASTPAIAALRWGAPSGSAPSDCALMLDDVRWYDRLLTESEIAAIYDPAFSDPDFDFLLTYYEATLGTDPLAADTDGDGRSDFDEVVLGSDPLVPDTLDPPLRIEGFWVLPTGSYGVQWRSVAGRRYRIQTSANGASWVSVSPELIASGQASSWTGTGLPLAGRRLFRVIQIVAD